MLTFSFPPRLLLLVVVSLSVTSVLRYLLTCRALCSWVVIADMSKKSSNPVVSLTSGCIAGAVEAICVWPLEFVKVSSGCLRHAKMQNHLIFCTIFETIYLAYVPVYLGAINASYVAFWPVTLMGIPGYTVIKTICSLHFLG